jgi:AbrB family looped-hinge helix DNA binding protein
MSITTLTSKGQITLPKEIRDRLALKQGDRFQVAIGGDGLLTLERDEAPPIERAFGMLRRFAKRKPVTITEMNAAVRRRAKKKHPVKLA